MNPKDKIRSSSLKMGLVLRILLLYCKIKRLISILLTVWWICKGWKPELVVGPGQRLCYGALAYALGGFVVQKPGKLPGNTELYEYDLEYALTP